MRPLPVLSAVFLTAATPVFAQVTVDLHALQALPERSAASHPARSVPAAPPRVATATPTQPATGSASRTVSPVTPPASPPAAQPAMPQDVPDTASVSPITPAAPPPGAQPPAPPAVSDQAATTAAPTTSGLRLTFAPGASDLNPESSTSIKQLIDAAPPGDSTTFNVLAYAPGKPDDPSTARRISLSRAMTVRSALVADGVPSARIFVRALGEQFGDGPPDRVDVSVTGANAPAGSAPAAAASAR
jgi:outer membrane protein OmpA-like peptidoglycan-associated protein